MRYRFYSLFSLFLLIFFVFGATRADASPDLKESSARLSPIEKVSLLRSRDTPFLHPVLPEFRSQLAGRFVSKGEDGQIIYYSLEPQLQRFVDDIVVKTKSPHVAAVVIEPETGKILAMAEKSASISSLLLHNGFPAASLFKIVTAAAALEAGYLQADSEIHYRGGMYSLNKHNYLPDPKRDKQVLTLAEGLGKSCNPLFARVALRFLNPMMLEQYSRRFGFNSSLRFDAPLPMSSASIPRSDFHLSRTAAGFGEVTMSPIHAASLMAGIANEGLVVQPTFVESATTSSGRQAYRWYKRPLGYMVRPNTARQLLEMMESTVTNGTAKRAFTLRNQQVLPDIRIAAKTGTLTGKNPAGLTNWFVAAAPIEEPKVSLAVVVLKPGTRASRAAYVGRRILEKYFLG